MTKNTTPRVALPRRTSGSGRFRALFSLGIVLGVGAVSTMAAWSDSATVQGGTFTTGTLDLKIGTPPVDNNPTQFTTDFAMSNMRPGSTTDAVLKVTNSGSIPFGFTATASSTNSGAGADQLGSALTLKAYNNNSSGSCTGEPISTGNTAADFALPPQQLAAAATQNLCFRATLPTNAAAALQGKSSVITLTLTAK